MDDWDKETRIGYKRTTPKVTKKDSDVNGEHSCGFDPAERVLNDCHSCTSARALHPLSF